MQGLHRREGEVGADPIAGAQYDRSRFICVRSSRVIDKRISDIKRRIDIRDRLKASTALPISSLEITAIPRLRRNHYVICPGSKMPKMVLAQIIGLRCAAVLDDRMSHVVPFLKQPNLRIAHCFVMLVEHASANRAHRTQTENDAGGNLVCANDDGRAETLVLIQRLEKKSRRLRVKSVLPCRDIVEDERTVGANLGSTRLVRLLGGNQLHESVANHFSRSRIYERSAHLKPALGGTRGLLCVNGYGQTNNDENQASASHCAMWIRSTVTRACSSGLSVTCDA